VQMLHRCLILHRTCVASLLACALSTVSVWIAAAETYPVRAIKLVVGSPAGGSTDVAARYLTDPLSRSLGQPVVIENRAGASGAIAARLVAAAAPDGYTVLVCTSATHGGNAVTMPNLGYDPIKDFSPVVRIATVPFVLAVNPALPVQSVKELVALAKSRPGKVRIGFAGAGSFNHIVGEMFAREAGIQLLPVPYKGLNQMVTDLIGDHIDIGFPSPGESMPLIEAGRVHALAITGPRRLAALPQVPTMAEAGFPRSELLGWGGLCAPAGTPPAVIKRLNEETLAAYLSPSIKRKLERQGYEIANNSPGDFDAFIKEQIARIAKIVDELGIRAAE
jgi:tripartite-type tricarboxylate transporter receptor subunit TctC